MQRLVTIAIRFGGLCVVACGTTQNDVDASMSDADSTDASADETIVDDAGFNDAGISFQFVDGGTECGLPTLTCETLGQRWTCCNGTLCDGFCIQLDDAATPECYCAGLAGCPNGSVCCVHAGVQTCTGPTECPTSGPPCPDD